MSQLPCYREWGTSDRISLSSEELLTSLPFFFHRWIPTCAQLFISQKEQWVHFAPKSDYDSSHNIEEYFASVASFMSLQLRDLVIKSLEDLVSFFMIHKVCRGPAVGPLRGNNQDRIRIPSCRSSATLVHENEFCESQQAFLR